jgi:hypothetical protein
MLAAAGCKSSGSGSSSSSRDPIFGGEKIPPQGLPVYGATKKDPLLKGATSTGRGEAMAEPYRPSSSTTNAALAGTKSTPESDTLAYSKDRAKGEIVPVSASSIVNGDLAERVRNLGGRMYAPVKLPSGEFEVRCAVPIGTGGAMRTYSAIGSTQAAAIRDLQAQIQADEKR